MIKEAFKLSFIIGLSPEDFWNLTPWLFHLCLESSREKFRQDHEHAVWLMWHGEALQRVKKMPPMKDLLASAAPPDDDKKQVPKIDEAVIIGRLKAYNSRLAGDKK